nr:hypothetical protein [Tanacetum cinerariifolium]
EEEEVADVMVTKVAFLVTRDSFSFSSVPQPSRARVPQIDYG